MQNRFAVVKKYHPSASHGENFGQHLLKECRSAGRRFGEVMNFKDAMPVHCSLQNAIA
jgi:hypothetical protein